MSQNESVKDRRKYQRVLVEPLSEGLITEIVDYGRTLLFDMSYEGAAIAQPKEKKLNDVGEAFVLHLKTAVDEAHLKAQVIRVNEEIVAIKFVEIDVAARIIIDRVVTDRIIGLNMSLISPKHYNANADFNEWYHGPKETNLYLWLQGGALVRAQIDLASASLVYEMDSFFFENKELDSKIFPKLNNQQIALKVYAILQQMETGTAALEQLKKIVAAHVQA